MAPLKSYKSGSQVPGNPTGGGRGLGMDRLLDKYGIVLIRREMVHLLLPAFSFQSDTFQP